MSLHPSDNREYASKFGTGSNKSLIDLIMLSPLINITVIRTYRTLIEMVFALFVLGFILQ